MRAFLQEGRLKGLKIIHNLFSQLFLVGVIEVTEHNIACKALMGYFQLYFAIISVKDAIIFASVHFQFILFRAVIIDIIVLEIFYTIFRVSIFFLEHGFVVGITAFQISPLIHSWEYNGNFTDHSAFISHCTNGAVFVTGKFTF